jgi:hypothetical protein
MNASTPERPVVNLDDELEVDSTALEAELDTDHDATGMHIEDDNYLGH